MGNLFSGVLFNSNVFFIFIHCQYYLSHSATLYNEYIGNSLYFPFWIIFYIIFNRRCRLVLSPTATAHIFVMRFYYLFIWDIIKCGTIGHYHKSIRVKCIKLIFQLTKISYLCIVLNMKIHNNLSDEEKSSFTIMIQRTG